MAALARALLQRYGVVNAETAEVESIAGGFSAVYGVLKAMEDAGRVRRGYFVADRGPTQFALPGADDRLRAHRDRSPRPRTVVLAATDPANPYGAVLPWPASSRPGEALIAADSGEGREGEGGRPQRAAGAMVVLQDGRLLAWLGRSGQTMLTWIDEKEEDLARDLARALARLVDGGRRKVLWLRSVDGDEPRRSSVHGALVAEGFTGGARGLHRRKMVAGEDRAQ